MFQSLQAKQVTVKDQLLRTVQPVLLGAALLLGQEPRALGQTGESAATAPKAPQGAALRPRQNQSNVSRVKQFKFDDLDLPLSSRSLSHRPTFNAETAYKLLQEAKAGSPQAMYDAGRAFEFGQGFDKEIATATIWYRRAIEKGYTKAHSALADCLLRYEADRPESIKEALTLLTAASKAGEPLASFRLAALHLHGFICKRDANKGVEYLELAISQGCPDSPTYLAPLLQNGEEGVTPNPARALQLLEQSARNGSILAKTGLGALYIEMKREKDALPLLEEAVAAESTEAKRSLGSLLVWGRTVPRDIGRALELLRSTAKGDSAIDQFTLAGALLEPGVNGDNKSEALRLLTIASEREFPIAQFVLAHRWHSESSSTTPSKEVRKLLQKSASKGFLPSAAVLGSHLAASNSKTEQLEGYQLLSNGAAQGYAPCSLALGIVLAQQSRTLEAEQHLRRAAEGGLSDAKALLALQPLLNLPPSTSLPPESKLAKEAADAGSAIGFYAYALSRGPGVQNAAQQHAHQLHWLDKAANAGVPSAQAHLGLLYLNAALGSQVPPNNRPPSRTAPSIKPSPQLTAAVKWLFLATYQGVIEAAPVLADLPKSIREDPQAARAVKEFKSIESNSEKELQQAAEKFSETFIKTLTKPANYPWRLDQDFLSLMCDLGTSDEIVSNAEYLRHGPSGRRDLKGALQLLTTAAQRNYAPAQAALAMLFATGDVDVPCDLEKAATWAAAAANNGNANGQYLYARLLEEPTSGLASNADLANQMLSKAAEQGHTAAAVLVAERLTDSSPQTIERKIRLLRRAADKGSPSALAALANALITQDEKGVQIPAEARKSLRFLAEQSPDLGDLALGLVARLDNDYVSAAALLSAPAQRESELANLALGMMLEEPAGEEKPSKLAKLKALRHYQTAAKLGSLEALTRIGILCERGLDDSGDYKLALEYHRKAAERGSTRSNYRLALLLSEVDGSAALLPEAHARLSISAAHGNEAAKKKLQELEASLSQEQRLESSKLVLQIGIERFNNPAPSGFARLLHTRTVKEW